MKSGCVLCVPIWCFNVWAKTCLHSALEARLHWRALGAAARAFSIKCLRSMCNSVYRFKKRIPSTKAGGGPSAQSPNRNATTCALSPCNNITEHMQLPNLMKEESNYMCPATLQQHNRTHPSAQSPNRNATTCALSPCNSITEHMQLPNLMREESNYMCLVTRQQHNITHPSAQSPKCASNTHM